MGVASGKVAAIILVVVAILLIGYAAFLLTSQPKVEEKQQPLSPKTKPIKPPKKPPKSRKPKQKPKPTDTEKTYTKSAESEPNYEVGIFRFNWVEYRVTVNGQEVTYKYTNLGEERVSGKLCYHQKVEIKPQGTEIEMWIDKQTLKCIKAEITVPGMGKRQVPCGQEVEAIPVSGNMRYVGDETVSVPAGTFNCYVFEGDGVKSWVAKGIGLLVKWKSRNVEGILLSYG